VTGLADRSAVRAEFAALLTANLTGPGKLAQAVFGYTVKDFGGVMPALVVGSAGTERQPFEKIGSYPYYLIDLWSFVLYADVQENGALTLDNLGAPVWDEEDSEAALDALEAGVRQLIDTGQPGDTWESIEYTGPSHVDIVSVGDASYRRELIPLRFKTM
jgi:hypothetical protein